jgi:hypothetical protein
MRDRQRREEEARQRQRAEAELIAAVALISLRLPLSSEQLATAQTAILTLISAANFATDNINILARGLRASINESAPSPSFAETSMFIATLAGAVVEATEMTPSGYSISL